MTRVDSSDVEEYLAAWMADPQLPLEVSRARYDTPMPRSVQHGAEVRRYNYGYWPSGSWGGIGYFDRAGAYHEVPDPELEGHGA